MPWKNSNREYNKLLTKNKGVGTIKLSNTCSTFNQLQIDFCSILQDMVLWQKIIFTQVLKWEHGKGNFQNKMRNVTKRIEALPSRFPDLSWGFLITATKNDGEGWL